MSRHGASHRGHKGGAEAACMHGQCMIAPRHALSFGCIAIRSGCRRAKEGVDTGDMRSRTLMLDVKLVS
jgi:hypothetical protein